LIERPAFDESFKADGVVPVALQDHMAVDSGNDAIDDIGGPDASRGYGEQEKQYEMGDLSHQNACPILKKKLK
jgi:hypothetical protein